jgi:putative membrane protein insertion efficiency factor
MAKLLILLIRGYQYLIRPFLPPSCRFYPSCSQYALEALRNHRVLPGLGLIAWRLLKCHPFHPGGFDPLPDPSLRTVEAPRQPVS